MQAEVVHKVLSLAKQAVKESHRDKLDAYIRTYCRAIPPEVLAEADPNRLLAFTMDRFGFLEEDFAQMVKVCIRDAETPLLPDDAPMTVIETRTPDCAFIVRTIKAFLRQHGIQLQFVLHPIHGVVHDDARVTAIVTPTPARRVEGGAVVERGPGARISQVYLQVSPIPPERRAALQADLEARLAALLTVNRDFPAIRRRFEELRGLLTALSTASEPRAAEAAEALELSDWLKEDNFVFVGYAWYPYGSERVGSPSSRSQGDAARVRPEGGLGLFALPERRELEEVIGEIVATRKNRQELYSFYRTDYTTVVRSVAQVRYFGVALSGPDRSCQGEHVFVGLISTRGLRQPNRRVPVVARRIQAVMDRLEDQPGSYNYGKIHAILDSIPIEDLFYWSVDEIHDVAQQFRLIESKDQARALVFRRPGGRRLCAVCVVPRMRFSEALREQLSQAIRSYLGAPKLREYRAETDDESPIRMHFTVGKYRPDVSDADLFSLKQKLELLLESWDDQLRRLVFKRYRGKAELPNNSRYLATTASAPEIWSRYGARFPDSYKGSAPPEVALGDVALLLALDEDGPAAVALKVLGEGEGRYTGLRIASRDELLLNDVVPVLNRMALRAVSRTGAHLSEGGPPAHITCFEVSGADGSRVEDEAALERLGTLVRRVLCGELGNDRLLGLGHLAGLDGAEVDLLIAYRNYFCQVYQGFSAQTVDETLLKFPAAAAKLVEYFRLKFSTELSSPPKERSEKLLPPVARRYEELLAAVTVIQEDAILRRLFDLFAATRRTNFYRPGHGEVVSFKIESRAVEHMPRPCPLYEIYVHGPGVEGIHLRGGKVARGGIRHSDRVDDFRSEVLGLQRTQTLKNTVIVPVGSKGGFIVKRQPAGRAEAAAEQKRQYEAFIGGLLDLTDTYRGSEVVPPSGVIRYDDDDPYLVVAADKGTAHLSDTANAISARYRFWLDDAFASGGSAGYDHKAMGITSKGGWTNVERHFREAGADIRGSSIRVAGVGDMSGDVFGNAMLLNDKLKLVAAFNHKHIFLDPEPDPHKSHAERKRLFELPGSQWSDYDRARISAGGGVFERAQKNIALPPECKRLLGITQDVVTGPDLVRAVLRLDVDLLWFGGIGTYVKATDESHQEVSDKVNDAVRVNASELRAKVIGEGANLAITQRARTEYWLHGGRCNTDAIDNSAGVDCSDHEVNLKILLAPMLANGSLPRPERDAFLRALTPDVAAACVRDNYLQSALLSMEATRSQHNGEPFLDLVSYLDRHGLNRAAERIPPDEDLRGWLATGRGLPRNLLAVLVAHTKNDLYDRVLGSRLPDQPRFAPLLIGYFPSQAADRYREQILRHPLRREIVATMVTNAIINQAGCTLLTQLGKESAAPLDELCARYFACDELIGGPLLRQAIHAADGTVAAADQVAALLALEEVNTSLLRWWIWNEPRLPQGAAEPASAAEVEAAVRGFESAFDARARADTDRREADLLKKGFGAALAGKLARLPLSRFALAAAAVAKDGAVDLAAAAGAYSLAGRELHFDAFDELLAAQIPTNGWERRFFVSIEREKSALHQRAAQKLVHEPALVERRAEQVGRLGDALRMARAAGAGGLVPLFLILEDYRALLDDNRNLPSVPPSRRWM